MKTTLTLELVTPLLLGGALPGALPNEAPELRPPAFRGLFRYWFRAVAGGVIGDEDLPKLRRLEETVFGSTERASAVILRLPPLKPPLKYTKKYILPHKRSGLRNGFEENQRFTLELLGRPSASEEAWQAACATVALALTCGGVGLRARRGYGTLRVVDNNGNESVPVFPKKQENWEKHVEQVTKGAADAVRKLAKACGLSPRSTLPPGPSRFPCANRSGVLWLARLSSNPCTDAMAAVSAFMNRVNKDPAFGGISPRQASPLWMRPVELGTKDYGVLLTVLASQFRRANYEHVKRFLVEEFKQFLVEEFKIPGWNA